MPDRVRHDEKRGLNRLELPQAVIHFSSTQQPRVIPAQARHDEKGRRLNGL
jgi:hypothetical protein